MQPVAVGALHHHVVGLGEKLGVADDGLVGVADVAGKDQFLLHLPLPHPQLDGGGAQQVPRVLKPGPHPVGDLHKLAVAAGGQQGQDPLRVLHGVEGLHPLVAGAATLAVFPLGVHLLDVGAVAQHDGEEATGGVDGVDLALKAVLYQQRQPAGVVDVGVGDQHRVDAGGGEGELLVVLFVPPLL